MRHRTTEVFGQLRERGYLVRYFDQPRIDSFVRVTIGTDEDMDGFIGAMSQILG